MNALTNADVAAQLDRYGSLLGLAGESPFRERAFHTAADAIRRLDCSVSDLAADKALRSIPGVGDGIAGIVDEIVATGAFRAWVELAATLPPTLLDLLALPGVGAKTVAKLHRELGIADLGALEAAADSGRLGRAPGFGARIEATVLAGLASMRTRTGRLPIGEALPQARALRAMLQTAMPGRIEIAGSVRRFAETVGDLDFVVETDDPATSTATISALPSVAALVDRFTGGVRIQLQSGAAADIFFAPPDRFGVTLVRATGSAAHLDRLGPLPEHAANETAVYAAYGLPWVPPELRLDGDEFARWAEISGLVQIADIRGDLHCHSTWTDGVASISTMAAAAASRGYGYLAITDHSQSLGVAGGLDPTRLAAQRVELAAVDGRVVLLHGSEVEVMRNGSLDFPDDVLAGLDLVVASLHVGLGQPREQLMGRMESVLRNRHVDVIAHPSGRLIERRAPGDFEWPRLFAMGAESGTAFEINADPARLDLDRKHAAAALAAGCLLEIDSDALHPDGFANIEFGVAVARQAWATADQIINTWDLPRLREWLDAHGRRSAPRADRA